MDTRFYNSEEIDIERLAIDLVNVYLAQGYKAQDIGTKNQIVVQVKKGSDFEAIIGMQAAVSLSIQRTAGGVLAMIGQQRWVDKAAVGAIGIVAAPVLWPLIATAGVGALRQASLGNQILTILDGLVRQQQPGVSAGPVPYNVMPQVQQQWAPPPQPVPFYAPPPQNVPPQPAPVMRPAPAPMPPSAPAQLRCSSCNTPYEPGDTFCTGCGRSLVAARKYCSKCNTEIKSEISFCPRCGSSTFQAFSAPTPPQPASVPTPTVTYTTPAPASKPAYTSPATPPKPAVPYYTPPATPPRAETPTYTAPTLDPHAAPTVASQPVRPTVTQKPPEPAYVPPITQTPQVVPQPKVTLVPGTEKKESAASQPQQPPKVYYTPSAQSQQAEQTMPATPPQPSQPKAASMNTAWATLIFSNGNRMQLTGERAVVGRYDNDLGGIQPDVDLAKMQSADTISRVHAALEHVGSTYTLTDLNSTNATRINNKRLEPDTPTAINDGDTLQFGKVTCTFKKL